MSYQQDHICKKEQEIQQMKIDLAVAKSDIAQVKDDIKDIKTVIDKFNWKIMTVLGTGMGSLLLILYGIISKGN